MQRKRRKMFGRLPFFNREYSRLSLLAGLLLFCNDTFFPPTGTPPVINSQRGTPQGVLRQLINAYETQRIDLYTELFSTSDFRFYVSHVFAFDPKGYQVRFGGRPCEPIDSMCLYVKNNVNDSCFYYWTYDEEIQRAERLFQNVAGITYVGSPTYADVIRYIVNGNGETTNVEVVMRGGYIYVQGISYPCESDSTQRCAYEFPIDIQEQVNPKCDVVCHASNPRITTPFFCGEAVK